MRYLNVFTDKTGEFYGDETGSREKAFWEIVEHTMDRSYTYVCTLTDGEKVDFTAELEEIKDQREWQAREDAKYGTALAVEVLPGQAHDAPRLEPLLDATIARVPHFDEAVCDKGFDGDDQRQACVDRDVFPNIPSRSNRVEPQPFLPDGYRERNKVERLFGKAKQFRRFATRYEKRKTMFLGVVHLVFGVLRLRRLRNINTA
ncbi:transposase [Limnoglobus roseus]|uniref:IS5/IS1182 family transposase n=1 Tax=Limnoglobus roseus TaxID=2598579 RepID=A0A5C1ANN9_9BACT|nr:transposase [Limnoglobus roseus]QEL19362.1 IS5/IS1182 family transposase [Limnoglobus roseus]